MSDEKRGMQFSLRFLMIGLLAFSLLLLFAVPTTYRFTTAQNNEVTINGHWVVVYSLEDGEPQLITRAQVLEHSCKAGSPTATVVIKVSILTKFRLWLADEKMLYDPVTVRSAFEEGGSSQTQKAKRKAS